MGDQAYGRVRQLGPDGPEAMGGVSDPRIEGAIGEKDEEQIVGGIDPHLRAGEAGMPVCGLADESAIEARLILIELRGIPAEEPGTTVVPRGQEAFDGSLGDPLPVRPRTVTKPCLRVASQVHARRKDAG